MRAMFSRNVKKIETYCFNCRTKQEIRDPQPVILQNGRPATQRSCAQYGTKAFRVGNG